MASLAQQFTKLRYSPLSSSSMLSRRRGKNFPLNKFASVSPKIVAAVVMSSGQTKERLELKKMFEDAYERCRTAPMEGVTFTVDDFAAAIELYDFNSEIGTKVKGTVFKTNANAALVDISAKSSAYLSVEHACIHRIKHVEEAGIVPGITEEFVIICENESDDSLLLSLRMIQYKLTWERCRQL